MATDSFIQRSMLGKLAAIPPTDSISPVADRKLTKEISPISVSLKRSRPIEYEKLPDDGWTPKDDIGQVICDTNVRVCTAPQTWWATGINVRDLVDTSLHPPTYQYTVTGLVRKRRTSKTALGVKVRVNDEEVAVLRYKTRIFAIREKCPHQGGPLHAGDIEDLDGSPCVSCPWHNWTFNLETGQCTNEESVQQLTYDVKIDESGMVAIGVQELAPRLFANEEF